MFYAFVMDRFRDNHKMLCRMNEAEARPLLGGFSKVMVCCLALPCQQETMTLSYIGGINISFLSFQRKIMSNGKTAGDEMTDCLAVVLPSVHVYFPYFQ